MRIGNYPVASIVLLLIFAAKLFIKFVFPASYTASLPVFDKLLMGTLIIFALYYIRLWVGAWLNNRREAKS